MPLSEQEQRLLEEMERSLYQNDADFVATVNSRVGRPNYRVLVLGVLLALVGLGALIAGVVIRQPIVGVLGFVVMFVGVLVAAAPPKRGSLSAPPPSSGTGAARKGSFMDAVNERWEKRQGGRG